jgi:hypothetical protein
MRRRTALVLLLGVALAGCGGGGDDAKPIDPALSQVTVQVDGMT